MQFWYSILSVLPFEWAQPGQMYFMKHALLAVLVLMILLYGFYEPLRNEVNAWWRKRFGDRGISRRYNNASFARALAMGLGSGLPLETAVEQAGKLLEDVPEAAMRCDRCAELLRSGAELPVAMETSGFLLRAESRMLAVGLKQGNSDQIMENIADRLLEQAEEALENTVAKIEPAMVLLASALVGAILLAVMLPLLMRSDAAFEGLVALLPERDWSEPIISLLAGLFAAWILLSRALGLHHRERDIMVPVRPGRVSPITTGILLGAVSILYLAYLFSQLAYFWGGLSGILPEGYTLADGTPLEQGIGSSYVAIVPTTSTIAAE